MPRYHAFLLRIWCDDAQWTARLEHLPDGTTLRFHNRAALAAYLGAAPCAEPAANPSSKGEERAAEPEQPR
jgi:hypothetical protein